MNKNSKINLSHVFYGETWEVGAHSSGLWIQYKYHDSDMPEDDEKFGASLSIEQAKELKKMLETTISYVEKK